MPQTFVMTFMADDRPGLVEKLSETVTAHGGNWLESRMAHLAEKFAGIARVEIPDDRVAPFKDVVGALGSEGFQIALEATAAEEAAGGVVLTLDLLGSDHPGIVHDISRCLADHGVSVEEMETDVREAPMGGGTLFSARVTVRGPADLNEGKLRLDLEQLSAALMIDVTFGGGA